MLVELACQVWVRHAQGSDLRLRDHPTCRFDGRGIDLASVRHVHLLDLMLEVVVILIDVAIQLLLTLLQLALHIGQIVGL